MVLNFLYHEINLRLKYIFLFFFLNLFINYNYIDVLVYKQIKQFQLLFFLSSILEFFLLYYYISILISLFCGFIYFIFQVILFIIPSLYRFEKKLIIKKFIISSTFTFIIILTLNILVYFIIIYIIGLDQQKILINMYNLYNFMYLIIITYYFFFLFSYLFINFILTLNYLNRNIYNLALLLILLFFPNDLYIEFIFISFFFLSFECFIYLFILL